MQPRLVHLAPYAVAYAGSFVPMLRAALTAARDAGFEPVVGLPREAEQRDWVREFAAEGIGVRAVEPTRAGMLPRLRELFDETRAPTIVHTHFSTFDMPVVAAVATRPRLRVFWHEHNAPRPELPLVARNLVKYTLLARRVERILCVAPDFVGDFRRRGAPRSKLVHFANAIDTTRFPPLGPGEREAARERLGLPADALVCLHFGWDWHRKGGDLFLEAIRLLRERESRPVVGLTVGGGAPARALARGLGIEDSVVAAPPEPDPRHFYAASDLFFTPSRSEGGPFTMAESLVLGVPVIATRLPSQELQAPGAGARRITGFDPRELADAAQSLLARAPEESDRDRASARQWVIEEMDLRPWAQRLVRLYEQALAR